MLERLGGARGSCYGREPSLFPAFDVGRAWQRKEGTRGPILG